MAAIEQDLVHGRHVLRYAAPDDFGLPEAEFLVCRFWLIDALCLLGRQEEARDRFADALALAQPLWTCSPRIFIRETGQLWGNFPQTYSMAGLILSAMRLSAEAGRSAIGTHLHNLQPRGDAAGRRCMPAGWKSC